MDLVLEDLGTDVSIRVLAAHDRSVENSERSRRWRALLKSDISRLDAAATKLRLSIGDRT